MHFEAVIISEEGFHKRGLGPNPTVAVTAAFRKICEDAGSKNAPAGMDADQIKQAIIQQIGRPEVLSAFCMCAVEDEFFENVQTLKEDVHDMKILIQMDRTKENLYRVCGWIRMVM